MVYLTFEIYILQQIQVHEDRIQRIVRIQIKSSEKVPVISKR